MKAFYTMLFPICFLAPILLPGQSGSCSGTPGDNIFSQGDFGRGPANIVLTDPDIAPGYTYTTSPPPQDGFYLITNDMANWGSIFDVWFAPSDNSDDPIALTALINGGQSWPGYLQWQRSLDEGATWENIPGATAATFIHDVDAGGGYHYRFVAAEDASSLNNARCRIVSESKIVQLIPKHYPVADTLCQGLSYRQGNNIYSQSGVYTDTLVSVYGCDSIVTLSLAIVPDPGISAEVSATPATCHDSEDGAIRIENIQNLSRPGQIVVSNPAMDTLHSLVDLPPGLYRLSIRDRFGCGLEEDITVAAPPPFTIDLGPDRSLLLGESVEILAEANHPIARYNWQPEALIQCHQDCPAVSFAPLSALNVVLQGISSQGCIASDSLYLNVEDKPRLYIPNAFSPNGDGRNDRFQLFGFAPGIREVEQLSVFDRWGGLVFQSQHEAVNGPNGGWDGTIGSRNASAGLYAYLARVRMINDSVHVVSGSVILAR